MNILEEFRLKIRGHILLILNFCLSMIPKKKNLVLFTSWFGQKYIDNSKYVYEYFLSNSDYQVVWMTKNKQIYDMLRKEGKPVAMFHSVRGLWLQVRAKAVFSSVQFSDYNVWLLPRCLYIDLGHGHPIKSPGEIAVDGTSAHEEYRIKAERVNYYAIVAGEKTKREYEVVPVSQDHVFISDYARNDVFIDEQLRIGKNEVIDNLKRGRKAIVYMPTHRSDGHVIMAMDKILPLREIQEYCEKNNYVFIIKKHFYHRNEVEKLEEYENIFDVTSIDDIDPQVLLYQADMLISDYSACYVDYMLLKRPVVFYQYDLNEYNNSQRSLYYDFDKLEIAPVIHSKEGLVPAIAELVTKGDSYLARRMQFAQQNYFDNIIQENGRAKVKTIFDKLYKEL